MDFEEFMVANNVSNTTLYMLKEKFEALSPVDEYVHQKLLYMFFVYLIVGGMPDAVKTYIESKGNIIYLPIYMSYLLKEQKIDQMIVNLDMDGL